MKSSEEKKESFRQSDLLLDEWMQETFIDGDPLGRIQTQGPVQEIFELRHLPPHVVRQTFLSAREEFYRQVTCGLNHRQCGHLFLKE